MPSVLQPWLEEIPIRMQSTLLLSLRGPDTHRCPAIKAVQRWMRGLTFKPGNPANVAEFMTGVNSVPYLEEKNELARELEFCSQHFYSHLMHGLEVIAYKYPDNDIKQIALNLFIRMAQLLHLEHEDIWDFEERLKQIKWSELNPQPDSFEEALEIVGPINESL